MRLVMARTCQTIYHSPTYEINYIIVFNSRCFWVLNIPEVNLLMEFYLIFHIFEVLHAVMTIGVFFCLKKRTYPFIDLGDKHTLLKVYANIVFSGRLNTRLFEQEYVYAILLCRIDIHIVLHVRGILSCRWIPFLTLVFYAKIYLRVFHPNPLKTYYMAKYFANELSSLYGFGKMICWSKANMYMYLWIHVLATQRRNVLSACECASI